MRLLDRAGVRTALKRALGRPAGPGGERPSDPFVATTTPTDRAIVERARPYTITSVPRLQAVVDSVRYLHARAVPGALAECGVWQGGSVLAMILTLQDLGVNDRDVYLYDTFEGMTAPTEVDTSPFDPPALETWQAAQHGDTRPWHYYFDPVTFTEEGVRAMLEATGYPPERLHFVRGKVEDTLPHVAPDEVALLRLDTDWYESTKHELEHLYPRLSHGGVLIVDDFGHWEGAARAVEEYFADRPPVLLSRIDYTARIAVKT